VEPTDDELIAAIESGSDLAFDRLMRRHRRLVYRVAYGFTGNSGRCARRRPETFLKVHTRLSSFRGEGSVRRLDRADRGQRSVEPEARGVALRDERARRVEPLDRRPDV
jgi:hypothetical protein